MKIEYITSKELDEFYTQLGTIIKGLDTTNPFEIIGFANSLTNMGNHYLNQITTKLIVKAHPIEELDQFKKNIKKPED